MPPPPTSASTTSAAAAAASSSSTGTPQPHRNTAAASPKLEFLKILSYPEKIAPPIVAVFDPHRQRDLVYSILNDSFSYEIRREDCIVHPTFTYYTDHGRYTNVAMEDRDRPGLFLFLLDIDKVSSRRDQAAQITQWMEREKINTSVERCIALLVHPHATGKQPLPETAKTIFFSSPQEKAEKLLAESLDWFAKNQPNLPVEIFGSVKTPSSIEGNLILARMAYCESWQNSSDPKRYVTYDGAAYRYLRFGMLGLAQQIYCRPLTAKLYVQTPSLQAGSWHNLTDEAVLQRMKEELAAPGGSKYMFPVSPSSPQSLHHVTMLDMQQQYQQQQQQQLHSGGPRPWPAARTATSSLHRHEPELLDILVHCCTCSILVLLRMNNAEGACQLARPHLEIISDALREAKKVSPAVAAHFLFRFSYAFLRLLRDTLHDDDVSRFLDINIYYCESVIFCRNALARTAVYLGVDVPAILVREAITASCPPVPQRGAPVSEQEQQVRNDLRALDPMLESPERIRRELRNLTHTASAVALNARRFRMNVQLECQIAELLLLDSPPEAAESCSRLLSTLRRERWSYVVSYLSRLQLRCEAKSPSCVPREEVIASCLRILALSRSDSERRHMWTALLVAGRIDPTVTLDLDGAAAALARHNRRWVRSASVRNAEEPGPAHNHPSLRCAVNTAVNITVFVRMPVTGINIVETRLWLVCESLSGRFERMCVLGRVNTDFDGVKQQHREQQQQNNTATNTDDETNTNASASPPQHHQHAADGGDAAYHHFIPTSNRDVALDFGCVPEFAGAYYLHQLYVRCEDEQGTARLLKLFPTPKRVADLEEQMRIQREHHHQQQQQQQQHVDPLMQSNSSFDFNSTWPQSQQQQHQQSIDTASFSSGANNNNTHHHHHHGKYNFNKNSLALASLRPENYWFIMSCEPEADVNFDVKLVGDAVCFADPRAPTPELHISIRTNDVLNQEPTKIELLVPAKLRTPGHGRTVSTTSLPNLSKDEGAKFLELRRRYRANHTVLDEMVVVVAPSQQAQQQAQHELFTRASSTNVNFVATASTVSTDAAAAAAAGAAVIHNEASITDALDPSYGCMSVYCAVQQSLLTAAASFHQLQQHQLNSAATAAAVSVYDPLTATPYPTTTTTKKQDTAAAAAASQNHNHNEQLLLLQQQQQRHLSASIKPLRLRSGSAARNNNNNADDDDGGGVSSLVRVASALYPSRGGRSGGGGGGGGNSVTPFRRSSLVPSQVAALEGTKQKQPRNHSNHPTATSTATPARKEHGNNNSDADSIAEIDDEIAPIITTPPLKKNDSRSSSSDDDNDDDQVVTSSGHDDDDYDEPPISPIRRPTRRAVSYEAVVQLLEHASATTTSAETVRQALDLLRQQNLVTPAQVADKIPRDTVCHVLSPVPQLNLSMSNNNGNGAAQEFMQHHLRNGSNTSGSTAAAAASAAAVRARQQAAVNAGKVEIKVPVPPALREGGTARLLWTYVKLGELREMQSTFDIEPREPFSVRYTLRPFRGRLFCSAVVTNTLAFSPLAILSATLECLPPTLPSSFSPAANNNSNNNNNNNNASTPQTLKKLPAEPLLHVVRPSQVQLPARIDPRQTQEIAFLFELAPRSEDDDMPIDVKHPVRLVLEFTAWSVLEQHREEQQQQLPRGGQHVPAAATIIPDRFTGPTDETDYSKVRPFSALVQHEPAPDGSPVTVYRPVRFFLSVQARSMAPLAAEHRQLRLRIDADEREWLPVGFTDRVLSFTGPNCQLHVLLDLVPLHSGELSIPGVVLLRPVSGEVVPVDLVVSQTGIVVR